MAGWQVVLLVLAGVFVGIWIPVSVQLWATLRSMRKVVEAVGTRSEETLARLTDTAIGLKATAAEIEELARAANQHKDTLRLISSIGAAVGPAVVALIRALRAPAATEDSTDEDADHPGAGPPAAVPSRHHSESSEGRNEERQ